MTRSPGSSKRGENAKLVDENEQLRASLEAALDENALLIDERDRLRERLQQVSRELRLVDAAAARQEERANRLEPALLRQGEAEEELRVAFEELQVLTEELEVANTGLQQTNAQLDARVEERTQQLCEINATLRSAEAAFRGVANLVPDLLWRTDRDGGATWFNQRWYAFTGHGLGESLGMGWLDAIHPADRECGRAAWMHALRTGKPFQHEHRFRGVDGSDRWFLVRAEPQHDDEGRILHWFAAGTDMQDQRLALEALQQSELRFRTLIEGMPQLVWRSADEGMWTWSSPQWAAYTGQDEAAAIGMGWLDAFHPDDRERAREAWRKAPDCGTLELGGRIRQASDGRYRHFRTRALPVRDDAGRTIEWLGTSTDIDDIIRLQEQQSVLVGELQHRTRNLMAVVQVVTRRTLKGVSTLDQFAQCIDDRFQALARVQGLLSRREGTMRVPFDLLLREELAAHVPIDAQGNGEQVSVDGPLGVPLRSATIQTLALALHELATNAVKYGALSGPAGHLHVAWRVEEHEGKPPLLCVDWRERGVENMPHAEAAPRGNGYGRELIERALPYQLGARTHFAFEPDGVHCTIDIAIPADAPTEKTHG